MNNQVIVVTRPMKQNDPTSYTYYWGEAAVKMMKDYGYKVIDLKKNEASYENVTRTLQQYRPILYVHVGHGCPASLQGQNECILTRRFGMDELISMPQTQLREIIKPLIYSSGCTNTCMSTPDVCNPLCMNNTNIQTLKGTIVYTIACYSASQLGKCSIRYGAETYIGYNDLMLFPVDEKHSQDMFRDVHLMFLKEILEGKTVAEAESTMNAYEDELIRFYKNTKYVSLPLLWNKLNRGILGNRNASIYNSH